MYKKLLSISIVVVILTLFGVPWLTQVGGARSVNAGTQSQRNPVQGIALAIPPFVGVAQGEAMYQSTIDNYFASGVAGITAYTNVGKDINIDKLATNIVFQTVEDSVPGEYVIGSVVPSGFKDSKTVSELMQVHVFVQREGWIVAYLPPEQPTAQIIDWSVFNERKLGTTILEDAVSQVATASSVTPSDLGYYHFSYPEATNLMFVGDVIGMANPTHDSFTVKIPSGLTIYESSFSHSEVGTRSYGIGSCLLNDEKLSEYNNQGGEWFLRSGQISTSDWKANMPNTIGLEAPYTLDRDGIYSFCGVAFVYGGAE